MNKVNSFKKLNIITKIKIVLFFIYLLFLYIYGGKNETTIYSEIILLIFIALEGIRILKTKKIKYCIPIVLMFVFAFYCFLSNFWAIDSRLSIIMARTLFILSAFLLITYNFFIELDNGEEYILKIIMYVGLIFSIYIILYYGIENYFQKLIAGQRVGTEINNVNSIGMQIAIPIIGMLYYIIYENKKIYIVLTIIPIIVSLGTGSRLVIIAITLGLFLLLLMKKEKINLHTVIKHIITLVILFIVFIQITKIPLFSTSFKRFKSMTNLITKNGIIDDSTEVRNAFIKAGISQFLKKPLNGIGIGNSGYITTTVVAGYFTYLHNNYVELLACIGIIGFSIYYMIQFYIIIYCIKLFKTKSNYIYLSFVIMITKLLLDYGSVSYYNKSIYIYMIFALVSIHNERKKYEQNNQIEKKS